MFHICLAGREARPVARILLAFEELHVPRPRAAPAHLRTTRSFAPDALIAPQCFVSGAQACLFRGSEPFLDGNGAFLAGYVSPYFGPVSFAIDHVGGSSAVSSTNVALNVRLWRDGAGTYVVAGIGGYLSNDRRGPPEGPSVEDGLFLQVSLGGNIFGLIGGIR